jgi:hypothetical protein
VRWASAACGPRTPDPSSCSPKPVGETLSDGPLREAAVAPSFLRPKLFRQRASRNRSAAVETVPPSVPARQFRTPKRHRAPLLAGRTGRNCSWKPAFAKHLEPPQPAGRPGSCDNPPTLWAEASAVRAPALQTRPTSPSIPAAVPSPASPPGRTASDTGRRSSGRDTLPGGITDARVPSTRAPPPAAAAGGSPGLVQRVGAEVGIDDRAACGCIPR